MEQEEQRQSSVIPVLVAVLVCDVAVPDPSTGKKNLIGIFDQVNVGKFPTQRQMSVYMKLADAEGPYRIEVRFVKRDSGEILAKAESDIVIKDRLKSADFHIEFPPLPIPAAGRYEFQIWANEIYLGGTFLDAVPRTQT